VFQLIGALAQFEREIIPTGGGWADGGAGPGPCRGRPSKLSAEQHMQARKMYDDRELAVDQIGQVWGVSRTSIYRSLGRTAGPAPPDPAAPSGAVEPAAVKADTAKAPVAAPPTLTPTPATGPPPAGGRGLGR